jgi:serine/threonine protein kinase/tetratricopeptide (TPR) repeat protein
VSDQSIECPGEDRLRWFLEQSLPEVESRAIASHLEICPACRTLVDCMPHDAAGLTDAPSSGDELLITPSPFSRSALERLRLTPRPDTADERTESPDPQNAPTLDERRGDFERSTVLDRDALMLDFLAPSDRPGSMGRIGHYEVLEQIGHGGMGVVLKALDPRLNRVVAIKVLTPGLASSRQARRRFMREAQAAAAVCHDHIVTIHAVDETAGQPYLVMQFVVGQSLQERIKRSGPLGLSEILRIGMQIASGLAAAHAQGLIHRDIKPANILLEGSAERVKITDFGLARAVDDVRLTTTGTIVGTPDYMSPEQAYGDSLDCRSDLFSLGGILYAMSTRRPPFVGDSTVAVLRKVSDDPPRPIRELNPGVPDWLVAIVDKLMAKDRIARYQTAQEVAELLARHLAELEHPDQPSAQETITQAPRGGVLARPTRARIGRVLAAATVVATAVLGTWWIIAFKVRSRAADRTAANATPEPLVTPLQPTEEPNAAPIADPPEKAKVSVSRTGRRDATKQVAAGNLAFDQNEFSKAIEHYSEAIRLDPSRTNAYLRRARTYQTKGIGNWSASLADLDETIRLDPTNVWAYQMRAYAWYRLGDFQRAIDDATVTIRLDPSRVTAYLHRGAAHVGLSQWDRAIVDLDECIHLDPKAQWAYFHRASAFRGRGELDRAASDLDRAIALDPGPSPYWIMRGQVRIANGDTTGGTADFAEALRAAPTNERYAVHIARGDAEYSLSMIEQAIADFTEAIRLAPARARTHDQRIYGARGTLYLAHAQPEAAIRDFDEHIRLSPNVAWSYHNRGLAYLRKEQFDRAITDFDAGLNAAGNDRIWAGNCILGRGDALVLAGHTDQADAAYQECLKLDPNRLHAVLESRAWLIDRRRGDYDAALKKLDVTTKGEMVTPFLHRGLIYARLGMADRALEDFAEVMKRVEKRREWFGVADHFSRRLGLLIGRGEAYLKKEELDRALDDSNEAVRFAPNSAEARLLRSHVHARRGETKLAEADEREAKGLAVDPFLARP